jgi:2'-5' RNA ligase
MRLFLALELPQSLLDELEQAVAPVREEFPEFSWTNAGKRHLTLKFLGDVGEERAGELVTGMEAVAMRHRPFAMELGGLGAFPAFRRARVLWIGVEQEARLELLHHDVEVACERVGFEVEGKPFRPHITLARVRTTLEVDRRKLLARTAKKVDFTASVPVSELTLFESVLAPGGSRYRRLHVATLKGGR